jgi:hypothetical protein
LILDLRSVHIQQATITTLHVNIHVTTKQLVYSNNVSFHQPIRVNPHSQLSGKRPRDSPQGGSHNWNPLGRPPLDPHVRLYKWSAPNPRMFMPPLYQPIIVQSKRTNKLPYWELQYPTYMKDISHDVHIRIFKKTIKANDETIGGWYN